MLDVNQSRKKHIYNLWCKLQQYNRMRLEEVL